MSISSSSSASSDDAESRSSLLADEKPLSGETNGARLLQAAKAEGGGASAGVDGRWCGGNVQAGEEEEAADGQGEAGAPDGACRWWLARWAARVRD
jgi:hypothetical protein